MTASVAVEARNLSCTFDEVDAVQDATFVIRRGEFVAIEGPSGSGKSTLLHLIAGIEEPSAGTICVDGKDLNNMSDAQRTVFRRQKIGVIFQLYDLLPTLTAWQNVAVPALLDGRRLRNERGRAVELLQTVELAHRADHKPSELSGGEQQRVAVARSLMNSPSLVLADEPTGALDSVTGDEILRVLRAMADRGQTVVMVTHEARAASYADRSIRLLDGRIAQPAPS